MLTVGAVSYAAIYLVQTFAQDEESRRADAEKDYQGGIYGRAARKYHDLAKDYGGSPHSIYFFIRLRGGSIGMHDMHSMHM